LERGFVDSNPRSACRLFAIVGRLCRKKKREIGLAFPATDGEEERKPTKANIIKTDLAENEEKT